MAEEVKLNQDALDDIYMCFIGLIDWSEAVETNDVFGILFNMSNIKITQIDFSSFITINSFNECPHGIRIKSAYGSFSKMLPVITDDHWDKKLDKIVFMLNNLIPTRTNCVSEKHIQLYLNFLDNIVKDPKKITKKQSHYILLVLHTVKILIKEFNLIGEKNIHGYLQLLYDHDKKIELDISRINNIDLSNYFECKNWKNEFEEPFINGLLVNEYNISNFSKTFIPSNIVIAPDEFLEKNNINIPKFTPNCRYYLIDNELTRHLPIILLPSTCHKLGRLFDRVFNGHSSFDEFQISLCEILKNDYITLKKHYPENIMRMYNNKRNVESSRLLYKPNGLLKSSSCNVNSPYLFKRLGDNVSVTSFYQNEFGACLYGLHYPAEFINNVKRFPDLKSFVTYALNNLYIYNRRFSIYNYKDTYRAYFEMQYFKLRKKN